MEQKPIASIIIPVYNSAHYLEQCLGSIHSSTTSDYEIIAVDDGSTDDSLAMLTRFQQEDPRIRVFSQKNGGSAKARNAGLDQATGKYILFVDSDDYIDSNLVKSMCAMIDKLHVDVMMFGFTYIDMDHRSTISIYSNSTFPPDTPIDAGASRLMLASNRWLGSLWDKVYRRSCIEEHGIRFDENLQISEDNKFNIDILRCIDSVAYTESSFYFYRQHEESTISNYRPGSFHLVNEIWNEKIQLFVEWGIWTENKKVEHCSYLNRRWMKEVFLLVGSNLNRKSKSEELKILRRVVLRNQDYSRSFRQILEVETITYRILLVVLLLGLNRLTQLLVSIIIRRTRRN